ncbi:MAG: D-alanine--D-alanine ligase [Candidatus Omnitrophota bacterium]
MVENYRIGVLAGGSSSERQISLRSGKAVFNALKGNGFDVLFLDVDENNFLKRIKENKVDIAFIALHGKFGEDGTVQKILEEEGISYTGSSVEASRLAIDKLLTKDILRKNGIPVPGYKIVHKGMDISCLDLVYPCVVKPRYEGSSVGLSVLHSKENLYEAVKTAMRYSDDVIIEDFISGREVTVGILERKALPVVEIIAETGVYDFDAKYESSKTKYIVPAELDKDVFCLCQEISLKAHNALGCGDFSRVDLRLRAKNEVFVLEINTIPGLTERSLLPMAAKACGLDFLQVCVKMMGGGMRSKGKIEKDVETRFIASHTDVPAV